MIDKNHERFWSVMARDNKTPFRRRDDKGLKFLFRPLQQRVLFNINPIFRQKFVLNIHITWNFTYYLLVKCWFAVPVCWIFNGTRDQIIFNPYTDVGLGWIIFTIFSFWLPVYCSSSIVLQYQQNGHMDKHLMINISMSNGTWR